MLRPALLKAYRATSYRVAGIEVRIGRRCLAMDGLLAAHGARTAVFITAYNPRSGKMPPGWNRRMQAQLARALRLRASLPARGEWRCWSEDHLVVFGDPRPAYRLGRRFRQNSVVVMHRGQPAQLVALRG